MRAAGSVPGQLLLPVLSGDGGEPGLMRRLDQMHLEHPVYGSRKLTALLRREGLALTASGWCGCCG